MPLQIETEFVEANGLRFEVLTCGKGERLALCLHGFPEPSESWRDQMPGLAAMCYRVWAPNQRGYGRSSRPAGVAAYSIENLMDDVAGLIDASGANEVALLGHDWGGIVAWCFATRRLRPLRRLIILNVPHPVCFLRSLRHPEQMLRSWYVLFFQLPSLPEWLGSRGHAWLVGRAVRGTSCRPDHFPAALLEAIRDHAAEPGALRAMIHWYRAFVRDSGFERQLRQGFPVIQTPTMVLWGVEDAALSLRTLKGTEEFVANLTIERLAGVSHWVQQDAPERCGELLRDFLSG